ncbi:M14 family metallopeptidase [Gorillibacterium sp. sgz5001074]|uniref:M14 family metallopeptidase n=1 Tax=Gorillibacterium sp. sgz5001074 TaxID=3446695 RepID=UPI003F667843
MTWSAPDRQPAVNPSRPFGYREWEEAKRILLSRYPSIGYERIGDSVLGRELGVFRIGTGKREIHYNGAMHGNEWMTGMLLVRFLNEVAEALNGAGGVYRGEPVAEWLESTTLYVMPLVNPDGVELSIRGAEEGGGYSEQVCLWNGGRTDYSGWKANIRGVDLNDQFPAYWETERDRRDVGGPGPRDFTGAAPLTEPEARALADWTRSRDLQLVIAFHMQGREIYWNYRDLEPPEALVWADRFAKVSGYVPVKLSGSDAGYKDWFIQEYRRPGFTVEAGFGVNPIPLGQFDAVYEETAPIMLEGLKG